MAEENLKKSLRILESKKNNLFQKVQILYDVSQNLNTERKLKEFKTRYLVLEETREKFNEVIERWNEKQIELDETYTPSFKEADALELMYCEITQVASRVLTPENDSQAAKSPSDSNPKEVKVRHKLPEINLMEFDGEPLKWPLFHSSFKTLIHDHPTLDNISKIQYLLSKLKGKALAMCAGIVPTEENYEILWKTLVNHFEDKRSLASTYLSNILEFQPLKCEGVDQMEKYIERLMTAVRSLLKLNVPELADFILTTLCLSKLDESSRRLFEATIAGEEFPTFKQLDSFVQSRAKILERTSKTSSVLQMKPRRSPNYHSYAVSTVRSVGCDYCRSRLHRLSKCYKFSSLSVADRKRIVFQKQLCFNCLNSGHQSPDCSSKFNCSFCNERHHSSLHEGKVEVKTKVVEPSRQKESKEETTAVSLLSFDSKIKPKPKYTVVLGTARVIAKSPDGGKALIRVLIDSASQCNFITREVCHRLGITIQPSSLRISGIGGTSTQPIRGRTWFRFTSRFQSREYGMEALVLDKITGELPSCKVDESVCERMQKLQLADDTWDTPGTIDAVIGAELVGHLLGPSKNLGTELPNAINSPLGVLLIGKTKASTEMETAQAYCCTEAPEVQQLLQKFWETENVDSLVCTNPEDARCEEHYQESVRRDPSGRYIVKLPFQTENVELGDSCSAALRRFEFLEKKFTKFPQFKSMYVEVMEDYLRQGHMKLCNDPDDKNTGYFIPHHGIVKASSSTTPLRVVFDASAKSSNGLSLNDVLYAGPKLQLDIFQILVRFRVFPVALVSDVKQMYRQIRLSESDQKYQKILWRSDSQVPLQTYQLTTVTFGVKCSPFLALRTLQQLAKDEGSKFPLAATRLTEEIYMDDVISSVPSISDALELQKQWVGLFKTGGFELVKWASNSVSVLEKIPEEARQQKIDFSNEFLKVLGLQWNAKNDEFNFHVDTPTSGTSKRQVLSLIARIWDPLGLLTPFTLWAKIFMQRLWKLKVGWDDRLPASIQCEWEDYLQDLNQLSEFRVPRHLGIHPGYRVSLFGFCDASEAAYAAVIYVRVETPTGERKVTLNCAKSKVAPVKTLSIPRLELCGALLLAKLINRVRQTMSSLIKIQEVFAFSDSMTTIHWINRAAHNWKTFVATRVAKIQNILAGENWYFVPGSENPADCASRGYSPGKFRDDSSWILGPPWLLEDEVKWPVRGVVVGDDDSWQREARTAACLITTTKGQNESHPLLEFIEKFSSWSKLIRATVYFLRFVKLLKRDDKVSTADLESAELYLVQVIQKKYFLKEWELLRSEGELPKSFRVLRPFIKDGLRVGGRLTKASLSYDQKFPLLLPKRSHFTSLLIDYMHKRNLHAGPNLLAALIRQKFWIFGARGVIRERIRRCNVCFRNKPKFVQPLMADLPLSRLSEVKPFLNTGVDFGGPFRITLSRHRGVKSQKAYLCLFTCMSTRAVHLECASDLSTECFLAAFMRFLSRRGPCSSMFSDQGTNFVGAKNYLNELATFLASLEFKKKWQEHLNEYRVEWKFNPPAAPHFGGLWEASIKSVKFHLNRVIGEQILSLEEFNTILCQIEALLNSRPLGWLSTDPAEPLALTPSHFLTLTPLQNLPSTELLDKPSSIFQRKRLLDQIIKAYWDRWRSEYISTLQTRQKWNTHSCPVRPGTVVVVHLENVPPLKWPLGIIREVFPGPDGIIRVILVQTKNGVYKRAVHKVAPLPSQ